MEGASGTDGQGRGSAAPDALQSVPVASHDDICAERLRVALDLADLAERMLRAKLRRSLPDASDEQIEQRIDEWYLERPGARHGDADGRPGAWPPE